MIEWRLPTIMDEPPPPYHFGGPLSTPPPAAVAHNPLEQLRRYIIEIMGFTFDANFSLLNEALGQTGNTSSSAANSILSPDERARLLNLATLIQEVEAKISDKSAQWLAVRSSERKAIADAVIRPALYLGIPAGYCLEMVSTYADHQCDGRKRSLSFVSKRIPYLFCTLKSLEFLGVFNLTMRVFHGHLWLNACITEFVAFNEEIQVVLANAIDIYQKEVLGIKRIYHLNMYLKAQNWEDVVETLISKDERKKIRSRRWSRDRKKGRRTG
ncbi:hypothetical protein BS50DRAFT_646008 [Corynespora cassiicola Philippines]|uniref:Uncharacterized protein n=1 Tax=Corynespora cassiicola Philippines TaxID=1448308 RepID=A0A2T2NJP5_CORCC|nr:hypothetical protein BS50DRAFT_646008 [Corynespora cassiicola Philippines]